MPTPTARERIGTTLGGRYELRRLIGEGGFSAVYEGVHTITGREVAIKILHSHLTTTEQIAERFLMEARAMARIKHDGIVQVLDAGTDPDGSVFIALELLDGESLEATLLRVQKLTWGEAVSICVSLLEALAEAHRHQIVHRDIKPGNIFIVRKGDGSSQAKLLDFGIAHVTQAKNKLTAAGMILGTPEYMSPEQGRSGSVGPESDLWSVGIVMWECLTGATPFVADTATEILLRVATTDAPSILDAVPDLPPPIAAVIDRSLSRDLGHRYRSADEMREAMLRALRKVDEAALATPPRTTPRHGVSAPERRLPPTTDVVDLHGVSMARAPASREARPANAAPSVPLGERPGARAPAARGPFPTPAGGSPAAGPRVSPSSSSVQAVGGPRVSPSSSSVQAVGGPRVSPSSSSVQAVGGPRQRVPSTLNAGEAPPEPRPRRASGENMRVDVPRPSTAATPSLRGFELPDLDAGEPSQRGPSPLLTQPPAAPIAQPESAVNSTAPRALDLTIDDRESRTYSGRRTQFQKPPEAKPTSPAVLVAALASVGLIAGGVALLSHDDEPHGARPVPHRAEPDTRADASTPTAPAQTAPLLRLASINDVSMPQGVEGTDNATEFARHAAASFHDGHTQRMIATCIGGPGGATLYVHPMTPGSIRVSPAGIVACAGFDLGVVPDVTADGSDDIVAVAARRDRVHLIDSRTLRPYRTLDVEGVRGVAVGAQVLVHGEPAVVLFAEPRGPSQPTEVLAVSALSTRVLWRARGVPRLQRIGHPVELGLAVGPDANGDGVGDVAAGLGPVVDGADADGRRCVQLYSGLDGRALWAQPFCRARAQGSQSVAVGPDVNGDGKADVVVGTEAPAPGDAPVVLLSGADGAVIRQIAAPASAQGFGWPVALGGDLNGDRTPELFVGTVGEHTGVRVFDATTGAAVSSVELSGLGAGTLRIFPVPTLVEGTPSSVAIASPGEGIRVYARRDDEESP